MGALLVLLGLASPLAVGFALDKWIKADIKNKLTRTILRKHDDDTDSNLQESLRQISTSLEGVRFKKISLMVLMSVIGIVFIYSGQYLLNPQDFNDYTIPFLRTFFVSPFKFILYLICFIIVDCFSFFQTYRFLMLSRGAKGLVDIIFIIFADIFLSLSLVVFLLPFLVSATYYLTSPIQENDFYVLIDNERPPETFTLSQFIDSIAPRVRTTSPSNTEERELDDLYKSAFGENWIHTPFSVSVDQYKAGKSISDAIENMDYNTGPTSILYTHETDLDELGEYITKIIRSAPGISSVELLDSSETPFVNRTVLFLRIKGQKKAEFSDILGSYFDNLGSFNFLNEELIKFKSISNMSINENSILRNALFQNWSPYAFREVTLICGNDEEPKNLELTPEMITSEISRCNDGGVVVSRALLTKFSTLLAFDYKSSFQLPILPTALSSLLLTALIYTFALVWLLSPLLGIASDRIIEGGVKTIEKNIFKIISVLLIAVFSILGFAIN